MVTRLRPLLLATLGVVSAFAATSPAPITPPGPFADLPPRIKAPTDQAEFRRFILDNGLRVLLVSDPKFNKSSAALVMSVGQIDDPADREGLAHFLEHMLFLGTEKYPEVSGYANFIQSNGGYNNAYTSSDHTNYQFEVRHEALPEALDRFAQFFIAPLFSPEFTGREINAVHNEAMRHVQNDSRRMISVSRELYAPGSGESKFSTGNKDTLAGATPAQVRAFYEATYTADRMALAICGKASLDELEKLARSTFGPIPRRSLPPVVREAKFLPRKPALRLAQIEPVKEIRSLNLEFVVPATRPDFASKPDELLTQLISYPGPGGLVESLKRDGLINDLNAYIWERTPEYGSLMLGVDLTPEGQQAHPRVLARIFSYLEHLRASPFPLAFYQDRARIAQLNETYRDRGEGAALATALANQALFYPLEIAERATDVWGKPDEAAYRRLLGALTPDNLLVSLLAKGVPTGKQERIYNVAYSYIEDTGAGYQALLHPEKTAFALPGANRFMPGATPLLAERPHPLIERRDLALFYAPDTEFLRPQTALIVRFVPVRDMGTADSAALLRLYEACLRDFLTPATNDAILSGLDVSFDASLEGFKFSVAGYGDSAARFATYLAENLRSFTIPPARFEALKEATLRSLRSYDQTEAYILARDRRDAMTREFHFLPPELLPRVTSATWPDVQAFAQKFFARGKVEAIVHGHVSADQAVEAIRTIAERKIAAENVGPEMLLRRRHLAVPAAETVVDRAEIAGVNSAFVGDYLLPDDAPAVRVASVVLSNFFADRFYSELRTKQQLGYIVGAAASASLRHRFFTFIVQSSAYAPDELRRRADAYIATLPATLAALPEKDWATLIAGARSQFEEKPKSIRDKAEMFFGRAFTFGGDWDRQQASLAALDTLTKEQALAVLQTALAPETARRRTILLASKNHPLTEDVKPSFASRDQWKAGRKYD
jgi:insulysin